MFAHHIIGCAPYNHAGTLFAQLLYHAALERVDVFVAETVGRVVGGLRSVVELQQRPQE